MTGKAKAKEKAKAKAENSRAGFVALIGAPNAGKSTLMNALVGAKVSIVSPKVQTTRARVRGIAMRDEAQVIFIDTPGIFAPRRRLDRAMVSAAWQGASDGDVVALVHDAARARIDSDTLKIASRLKENNIAAALVLNKIDLIPRERLLKRAAELAEVAGFKKTFMVSASKAEGTDDFLAWLAGEMPPSPYYFDPDDLSDMPERLLAAEIMREKLFRNLHQELPYQLTVETELWRNRPDGSAEVRLVVFVTRANHRGIVLGRGGATIGRIGQAARLELERILGRRVHLLSHVKHAKDWMNDPRRYRDWDLDFDA